MMKYNMMKNRGQLNEVTTVYNSPPDPGRSHQEKPGDALVRGFISPRVLELIPISIAYENLAIPLNSDGEKLTVAVTSTDDIALRDKLTFILNRNIRFIEASEEAIREALHKHYGEAQIESVDSMIAEFYDTAVDSARTEWKQASIDREEQLLSEPITTSKSKGGFFGNARVAFGDFKKGVKGIDDDFDETPTAGQDTTPRLGGTGMFYYVVEEGQQVLKRKSDGSMEIIVGPKKVWRGKNKFVPMKHFVAHPGEFLIIRYRDGRQEHLPGPSEIWMDPRVHKEITRQEALQLASKEAVVVYSQKEDSQEITRRVQYGPGLFMPRPGEWLHTFSWHASKGGHLGVEKVPNGLVFQKLWLMPDQMYHDVRDVRTSDDAVLTIRLMMFFELVDIERMLDTTHDPIGDFVNAATSDVVDWVGRHNFDSFKASTAQLNEIEAYRQLTARASQCGYRIGKVVYRGYGAAESLQQMHDQAIEARTRLQLERATEQQAQDLENYKLDCQIERSAKRRTEQESEVGHDLQMEQRRTEQRLRQQEAQTVSSREQRRLESEMTRDNRQRELAQEREHLQVLREMGVDLTSYLTQARADQVIELRGGNGARPHVHLESGNHSEQRD